MLAELKHSNLTLSQIYTLNSYKSLVGTELLEMNYTADYKMDEFMDIITKNNITYGEDMRKVIHDLLAPGSPVPFDNFLTNNNPGCSTIIAQDGQTHSWLMGRNYDLDKASNGVTLVLHTAPKDGYKSVGVVDMAGLGLSKNRLESDKDLLLYAPYNVDDGVNEKGFAISVMLLEKDRNVQSDEAKKLLPMTLVARYLLDKADSVESAIELLKEVNLTHDYAIPTKELQDTIGKDLTLHWSMSDASGDMAIVEYVNGKMQIIKKPLSVEYDEQTYTPYISYPDEQKPYLINTNFYLSQNVQNTTEDEEGFWRYATAQKLLEANPTPSKYELVDIMSKIKYFMNDLDQKQTIEQAGKDPADPQNWKWMTIWTDILDTNEKNLKLFYKEDYTKEYNFGLDASSDLQNPFEAKYLTALIAQMPSGAMSDTGMF